MNKVSKFIKRLSELELENCFNPYADKCDVYDLPQAPKIRKSNLGKILNSLESSKNIDVWVGRDLGYRGGRRTGLALTDEISLNLYANHLRIESLDRSTFGHPVKERTAYNIYTILSEIETPVLTWNVFPLHPHNPCEPFTNRQHTRAEGRIGITFLEELCDIFPIRRLVAIGNHAASWANEVAVPNYRVRHPSYGGQSEFLSQMRDIYHLPQPIHAQMRLL
ncbi:MAG: uracil-DNA glycosylase [Phyllobacteriaceae bacterium]|nr:uracil-DNA glycosylase [Phyllobacteriaceae bacterium]